MTEPEDKLRRANAVRGRLAARGRPKGFDHRRLARTLLLGTLAAAAAIYWLGVEYGADWRQLVGYLGGSVLFVVLLAVLAVAGAVVLRVGRRLASRRREPPRQDS